MGGLNDDGRIDFSVIPLSGVIQRPALRAWKYHDIAMLFLLLNKIVMNFSFVKDDLVHA